MGIYRDPDDAPVDPTVEDDEDERRGARPSSWGPTDPDALRPARLAGEDAGGAAAPDEPPRRPA